MKKPYVEGSEDLGVADPLEARAKADLAHCIVDIIEGRKLTQVQAAHVLGVDQPKVSALMRGRLTDFSIEPLLRFLLLFGHDVHIAVSAKPRSSRKQPTLRVYAAQGLSRVRRVSLSGQSAKPQHDSLQSPWFVGPSGRNIKATHSHTARFSPERCTRCAC